jgi:Fe-S-cluster-containing hydrogenase component 2/CRP-like cAMP-binding protein
MKNPVSKAETGLEALMPDDFSDELFDIYESQYARDLEGKLIRIEAATERDLQTILTVTIDGREVKVPKASPATDDQGNLLRDNNGRVKPRLTTIYDAATLAYTSQPTEADPIPRGRNPIPVLCHQAHVRPIGVCRVCSVLTSRKGQAAARLFPACCHPVVDKMVVHTVASEEKITFPGKPEPRPAGAHVRQMVGVLVELLANNHLHKAQEPGSKRYQNELEDLVRQFDVPLGVRREAASKEVTDFEPSTPFVRRGYNEQATDDSSVVISVDHNQCIFCDRCVRACSEVKPFRIIGHTGFGHRARISFDLGQPMGESGCVSCGECAVSCPTGALSFKGTIYQDRDSWADTGLRPETVNAEDLQWLPLFAGVPLAYLRWNQGSVGRLNCQGGEILCRDGEYGATAFIIERGEIEVLSKGKVKEIRSALDFIVGEMACLTNSPRTATLRAKGPASILVIRRNMLHMLRRNKHARLLMYPAYRKRALQQYFLKGQLFSGLEEKQSERCLRMLQLMAGRLKKVSLSFSLSEIEPDEMSGAVDFLQVDPGELIFREGDEADSFYIVYLGRVEVSQTNRYGQRTVVDYLEPGQHFGEIGLLSTLSPAVRALLPPSRQGRRTASCTALDHVELVRIDREAFRMLLEYDAGIRKKLEDTCRELLDKNRDLRRRVGHELGEFTKTGLYQGQNLLLLDLHKCTRCQECVRACAETHGGITRLLLEGNRFGTHLVPSACRSCHDPLCLVGCPVDAIHRRQGLAVRIEDHCIGCGLCAQNCPYGSIHMIPRPAEVPGVHPALATNCDLCESLDGRPRCVFHCPHDAAHRGNASDIAVELGLRPER